jgi:hypothetical protein
MSIPQPVELIGSPLSPYTHALAATDKARVDRLLAGTGCEKMLVG